MSIIQRMDKENVAYRHDGILYSYFKKKNKSKPFAAKWVQLEDKFNEVSQA